MRAQPYLLSLTCLGILPFASGCTRTASARSDHDYAPRVAAIVDLHGPESVRYDPQRDVYYISNMMLYGSWKDDNGYIVEVNAADVRHSRILVQGGVKGVTLNAPKGMAIHGDTLWVADIDVLRGFDRVTGAPLATIEFPQHPTLLNDVAVGPDSTIHITDTGIVMSEKGVRFDTTGDRIFVVGRDRAVSVLPADKPFPKPNGITWDAAHRRWLVVTFGNFDSFVYALVPGDTTHHKLVEGKGRFDGVEALADGRVLFTCWRDSSVHVLDGTTERQLVRHVPSPADIGVDTKRGILAIPLGTDKVELYQIPAR